MYRFFEVWDIEGATITYHFFHQAGYLVHKHKTKENNPLLRITNSAEQAKKSRKIAWPQITAHNFRSFPNGMVRTI